MKRVSDKIIEEKIELYKCGPGDRISFGYRDEAGRRLPLSSTVDLVKVKRIPNSKVQIKYRGTYSSATKVQKVDLCANLVVTRYRKATSADIHPVKAEEGSPEMSLTEVLAAGLSHPITRELMRSRMSSLPVVTARQSEELVDRILKTAEIAFSSIVLDSVTPDISPNPPISIDNLQESLNNLPKHRPGEIIALPGSNIKKS